MIKNYLFKLIVIVLLSTVVLKLQAEGRLNPLQFEMTTQPVDRLYTHLPLTYVVSDLGNQTFSIQLFHQKNCLVNKTISVDGFGKKEMNEIAMLLVKKLKADQPLKITTDELTLILNHHQSN